MKIKQVFKRVVAGLLTAATVLTSISLPAFATPPYNGDGGGKTYFTVGTIPGTSEINWGYRFAIVDPKTGKVQDDGYGGYLVADQVQVEQNKGTDQLMNAAYQDNFVRTDINTNLGTVTRHYEWFSGEPTPITTSGGSWVGQGAAFKDWMTAKDGCVLSNGKKMTWAEYICYDFFGEQVRDDLFAGKYKLVIEPIYLIPLYTDYIASYVTDIYGNLNYHSIKDKNTGKYKYSSFSGRYYFGTYAGSLKALYNLPTLMNNSNATGGSGGYQSLAVRASAKCMYLDADDDDLGLNEAPDLTDYYIALLRWSASQGGYTLGKDGYGIHILTPDTPKDQPIHTYDIKTIPNPTVPAPSEEPKEENGTTGKLTIYKVYGEECRNPETGKTKIMNIQYFATEGCTKQVVVMDEKDTTGYELVAWGCDRTSYNKWIFKEGDKKGEVDYIVAKDWAKVDKETQEVYYNTFKRVLRNEDKEFAQYYLDKNTTKGPKGEVITLTYDEEAPLQVKKENKVIYLLYLKKAPWITTYGRPTPPVPQLKPPYPPIEQDTPPEDVYFPENPDNPNNPDPKDPTKPMSPDASLRGNLTIVKVYGTRVPETQSDGTEVMRASNVATTFMERTTYNVLIEDEDNYDLVDWKLVDSFENRVEDVKYTAKEWLDDNGFDKTKEKTKDKVKVVAEKAEDEEIEKGYKKYLECDTIKGIDPKNKKPGVLYLLYLKDPEPISTFGRPTPPDPEPGEPTPKPLPPGVYYPENPDNPNNPDDPDKPMPPNPELKGELTIVKVYGKKVITDNGDGTTTTQAKHVRTTYMENTTYKVLIEGEPEYNLVDWKLVDKEKDIKYKAPEWLDGFDKKTVLLEKDADEEIGPEYSKEINCNIDGIDPENGKPGVLSRKNMVSGRWSAYPLRSIKSAFRFVHIIFQVTEIKKH